MNRKLVKKHAVMMEYVILAVLIAAAVVVAVMVFGRSVKSEFNVATKAMTDAKTAETDQQNLQWDNDANTKKATDHAKNMQNYSDMQDSQK